MTASKSSAITESIQTEKTRHEQKGREIAWNLRTKKRCLLFCEHKRHYCTVGISNMHSKAAGTVQLNECCGQNMKGLNTATFSSDMSQQNQNADGVRSNLF